MNDHERAEREHVMRRDGRCVLSIRDPMHVCRRMGMPHRPDNVRLLTVEHVKDQPMMGRRAPSDRQHMVAMCFDANVAVPSRDVRTWIREYLSMVEKDKKPPIQKKTGETRPDARPDAEEAKKFIRGTATPNKEG